MTNGTAPNRKPATVTPDPTAPRGGHGWLMTCCVPMVAIAVALVATGAVSSSFLLLAGFCVGMMFMMMRIVNHGATHTPN